MDRHRARSIVTAPLTPADVRALRLLVAYASLVRPGHFGELLWPNKRRHSSNCSAPLARPAGKVLKRLERAGYAQYLARSSGEGFGEWKEWGWAATWSGQQFIRKTA